jgi:hypothetical protein
MKAELMYRVWVTKLTGCSLAFAAGFVCQITLAWQLLAR